MDIALSDAGRQLHRFQRLGTARLVVAVRDAVDVQRLAQDRGNPPPRRQGGSSVLKYRLKFAPQRQAIAAQPVLQRPAVDNDGAAV